MNKLKLGQKVLMKNKLVRNYNKPRYRDVLSLVRYEKFECDKIGFVCGKSTIHIEGYTDFEDGYPYFVPVKSKAVYMVAIKMNKRIYVDFEDLKLLEEE